MNFPRASATTLFALLALAAQAQQAPPAPPFDVAYRAWDVVTELARSNGDPALSGECGRTFRPFVIPGLRMQNRQEQDQAAAACVAQARAVCGNAKVRKTTEEGKKCGEFR
ncbi:hypothetical protein H8N03_00735 [Ramlibacter sp. USB13]|uniref:Uncharacterized protein n=1 Tax=Ramlibacter cellulosilyticus TaxID=2764187 RepID=A0A923MME9_9BURK|nr:hypothetical protein [Ramlibacter cellulosilyticus]MBC5781446.1 hypothetical protein [Ramlibacter cellulosilyticus]